MKLKTFQDLVLYEHLTDKQIAEAKEEAIKWVRKVNPDLEELFYESENEFVDYDGTEHMRISRWIKHFFDIKEKDLK